jgi:hypothetical protein
MKNARLIVAFCFCLLGSWLLCACNHQPLVANPEAPKPETTKPESSTAEVVPAEQEMIICQTPRPQVCTLNYLPVCAERDTGIRCITAPCPSTERKTYSNACSACADLKVLGYRPAKCESAQPTASE